MVLAAICFFFLSEAGSVYYYTQIDNSKIEQVESRGGVIDFTGGMSYQYTLFSCDEKGKGKDITFGTSRELKEGAFVRLTVMPIRGVLEWEEVQYDELPVAVQSILYGTCKGVIGLLNTNLKMGIRGSFPLQYLKILNKRIKKYIEGWSLAI